MSQKPRYRVTTWDPDLQKFTPQKGLRCGPYYGFGVRKALQELRCMGYDIGHQSPCVLVERYE
jgi:hypothetical protein